MKFYTDNKYDISYRDKILNNKLTAILSNKNSYVQFFKNGMYHNTKNADFINHKNKEFSLNNKFYGNQNDFTKQLWRRFIKLRMFL